MKSEVRAARPLSSSRVPSRRTPASAGWAALPWTARGTWLLVTASPKQPEPCDSFYRPRPQRSAGHHGHRNQYQKRGWLAERRPDAVGRLQQLQRRSGRCLPAGATGTFNPASLPSGNSTLSITTSSTTPTGTFPLTISGTSGSTTHTASVNLVVTAPVVGDFSISASPGSQTVTAGNGTSYTATVTGSGGFSGAVNFTASGLPSGAGASLNPTSVTDSGSSTISLPTRATTPARTLPPT